MIQLGDAPLTALTGDLGLYSQVSGLYLRFVTNAAPFLWFIDSGIGTTSSMSLTAAGNLGIGTGAPARRRQPQARWGLVLTALAGSTFRPAKGFI